MTVRTYQCVGKNIRYIEDYVIGENGDYMTIDDLDADLNDLVGYAIDSYEIEVIEA